MQTRMNNKQRSTSLSLQEVQYNVLPKLVTMNCVLLFAIRIILFAKQYKLEPE